MEVSEAEKYSTEEEILLLVEEFEAGTIPREAWKHREHLVVALYYISKFDLAAATKTMRRGILRLLEHGFGVDLEKEMPYHETLTIFWMNAVHDFWTVRRDRPLCEIAADMIATLDKDYPLEFYTREYLFSDDARKRFVAPDLP